MKIIGVLLTWNNLIFLKYSLKQALQFCDEVIVVEGGHSRFHDIKSGDGKPGSGLAMWRRDGAFINAFKNGCRTTDNGGKGGSQDLINIVSGKISFHLIKDPLLHFVSPDRRNPKITDAEIETFSNAYIHLHGPDSFERLKRFYKIFYGPRS